MKSQKGVTLISLTVYVIVLLVVVVTLSTISGYFFSNYNKASKKVPVLTEYTKFTSYISQEVNKSNIRILLCETNTNVSGKKTSYIVFSNKVQYTFVEENKSIYQNKVKICRNVEDCSFSTNPEKTQITINIKFKGDSSPRQVTYTLKN